MVALLHFPLLIILTDCSELDAAVSKLKLELKAFYQSLEASISNLDVLTKHLTDLHKASSQLDQSPHNFTFNEPISRDNVVDALHSCKVETELFLWCLVLKCAGLWNVVFLLLNVIGSILDLASD